VVLKPSRKALLILLVLVMEDRVADSIGAEAGQLDVRGGLHDLGLQN
jgi:hypothetical protein